jgi:hypothetical protein
MSLVVDHHHFTPLPKDAPILSSDDFVVSTDLSGPDSALPNTAKAFHHLDGAELGWFHLRAVIVAGVGFLTDAYDLFVISLVIPMIYQGETFHLCVFTSTD